MSLSRFDRLLVILLVLEVMVAASPDAFAAVAPPNCDTACRERRFTQNRDVNAGGIGTTSCIMTRYRTCHPCTLASGGCSPNPLDAYSTGTCKDIARDQEYSTPPIVSCDAMCPIPTNNNQKYSLEAAEGPNTYQSVLAWVKIQDGINPDGTPKYIKVKKCTSADNEQQVWDDEGL